MADFTANIKVQFELLGLTGGGDGGGSQPPTGGGTGGGQGGSGPDFASLRELREEFSKLAASVRAINQGLEQIKASAGSAGSQPTAGTGASSEGTGASGVNIPVGGVNELTAAVKELDAASSAAADRVRAASEKSDAAAGKAEQSQADAAAQAETYAEILRRVNEDTKSTAEGVKDFAGSLGDLQRIQKRNKGLEALDPRRVQNELNPGGLIKEVFENVSRDPELRKAAASLNTIVSDTIKIDPKATSDVKTDLERVRGQIQSQISTFLDKVEAGSLDPSDLAKAGNRIRQIINDFNRSRTEGQTRIRGTASGDITRSLGAAQLIAGIDRVDAGLEKLGAAIDSEASGLEQANLKRAVENLVSELAGFTGSRFRQIFGSENDPKFAAGARQSVAANLRTAPAEVELVQPGQLKAFQQFREAVRGTGTVFEASRRIFDELTRGGTSLRDFDVTLRNFVEFLKGPGANGVARTREEVAKFNEVFKLLRGTTVTAQGAVRAPSGAIGAQVSQRIAGNVLEQGRARLFEPGRGVGSTQRVEFQTQDASGNIRRITADLTRLGNRLDQVRVKARDTSDNMFDRTSVRAALQRVATWGAAAGIVFGAVDAFRNAVSTVVSTESAVIGLAKVMDESATNFEGFKRTATEAAIAISQEFGQPLADVLDTLTLFGQQGLNLADSIERAGAAALAANVTTLNQPEAASALTAALAQFSSEQLKATDVVDKFNEVSNNAAVTETVLAQAVAKAGQAANTAGVSFDQFNGIVAAISEQTRQSGNEIGTALRFIFSRLQTPEAESGLSRLGISVRNAAGETRGFVPIIEELAAKFDGLSNAQKTQVAISIAGTRRFNTLLALLDNFSRFQESAANSADSAGSALREQSKVAETAAFRIQQLKNSLSALAVSLGDSLLGPIKVVVDAFKGLVNIVAALPSELTTAVAGIGLGAAGLARFGDRLIGSLGLVGAFRGLGTSIGQSLVQGISEADFDQAFGARSAVIRQFNPGVFAARLSGDLAFSFKNASKDASGFTTALAGVGRQLTDSNGRVVKNASSFTKLGSVIRGFRTADAAGTFDATGKAAESAAIGIGGLNSGFSKLVALAGGVLNAVASRIPILGRVFDGLDTRAAALNSTLATTGVLVLRLAAGAAAITGLVIAFRALSDALTATGESRAKEFEEEIAQRQESLKGAREQIRLLGTLQQARDRAAAAGEGNVDLSTAGPDQARLLGQISRREFRSPVLEQQRAREREFDVSQQVAVLRPELIRGFDQFGNVILESADALETFANSASNAQANLLALSQVKAIEALSTEFGDATGIQKFGNDVVKVIEKVELFRKGLNLIGVSSKDTFTTAKEEIENFQKDIEKSLGDTRNALASNLSVPLELIDPKFAEKQSKLIADQTARLGKQRLALKAVQDQVRSLPSESAGLAFNTLLGPTSNFQNALDAQANDISTRTGRDVNAAQVARRLRLQVSSAFQNEQVNVRAAVGFDAEETIARFRESGIAGEILDLQGDLQEQLDKVQEGDLVLFKNVQGLPDQAFVELDATGQKVLRTIDDGLKEVKVPLQNVFTDLAGSAAEAFVLDPRALTAQVNSAIREASRVIQGAARGNILSKDIELGAQFSFDLTAQQRVAFSDETLITGIVDAEQAVKQRLDSIGASLKVFGEDAGRAVTSETISNFNKLAIEADKLKVILRVKTQFEEVVRAFEKAVDDIDRADLKGRLEEEFSTFLGARRGIPNARFEEPLAEADLSGQQVFNRANGDLIRALNRLTDSQRANRELVAGAEQSRIDAATVVRDFQRSIEIGGVRDPQLASSALLETASRVRGGVDRAQAEQIGLAALTLREQTNTNRFLQIIAENTSESTSPQRLGSLFRQAAENLPTETTARSSQLDDIASRLDEFGANRVSQFGANNINQLVNTLGTGRSQALDQAFRELQVVTQTSATNTALLGDLLRSGQTGRKPADEGERKTAEAVEKVGQETVRTIADRLRQEGGRASPEDARTLAREVGKVLKDSDNNRLEAAGKRIFDAIENDLEATGPVLSKFRDQIDAVNRVVAPRRADDNQDRQKRSVDEALKQQDRFSDALIKTVRANATFRNDLLFTGGQIKLLGNSLGGLRQDLSKGFNDIISDFNVGAVTEQFTGNLIGTLQGVVVPQVDTGKFRGDLRDLSARELTAFESPELGRNLQQADQLLKSITGQFTRVAQFEQNLLRERDAAASRGDNAQVSRLNAALREVGDVSALVEGRARSARNTLQQFGEAFRNIEAVNQLRQDVVKLFEDFRNQQALLFDRTSIETALGRGPFASTRPTFEQFEQGQGGDLTRFERAIESIAFRRSRGELGPQEARRETRRAEFERDESIIAFAQQRETQQLEAQVRTAEQVRARLQEFALSGGPGAGVAAQLVDSLGQELATAGDTIATNLGRQTIRDPRTGREVDIPASEVRQFRGVPGLENAVRQVQQLAQQARQEESASNAALINKPIVSSISDLNREVTSRLDALIKSTGEEGGIADGAAVDRGQNILVAGLPKLFQALEILSKGEEATAAQNRDAAKLLSDFVTGTLEKLDKLPGSIKDALLTSFKVTTPAGEVTNVDQILKQVSRSSDPNSREIATRALEGRSLSRDLEGSKEALDSIIKPTTAFGKAAEDTTKLLIKMAEAVQATNDKLNDLADKAKGGKDAGKDTKAPGFASGGLIQGPGGPRDDRVPIRASAGEFVLNARAVQNIGIDRLNEMNQSNGTIGPDRGINLVPSTRLEEGGSVFKQILRLQDEKARLQAKKDLNEDEQKRVAAIDAELQGLQEQRIARKKRLAELRNQGVRLGAVGEETVTGVRVPDSVLAQENTAIQELKFKELKRRDNLDRRGGGTLGGGFPRGKFFVGVSEDGKRMSFSDQPGPGRVDASSLRGAPVNDPRAFKRELARREKFKNELEGAKQAADAKLRGVSSEFLDLAAEEEEEQSVSRDRASFGEALEALLKQLNSRTTSFVGGLAREQQQAINDFNTGQIITSGKSDIGSSERKEIGRAIKANARLLIDKTENLRLTELHPLTARVPPEFNEQNFPVNFRAINKSSVGVGRDFDTNKFKPSIFGFALGSTPELEEVFKTVVEEDLGNKALKMGDAVIEAASFKKIFGEANGIARLRDGLDFVSTRLSEFAERKGGVLGTLASGASFVTQVGAAGADIGSNLATGAVGVGEDIVTGKENIVTALAKVPKDIVVGTVEQFTGFKENVIDNSGEIAKLEVELENTKDRDKRLKIQREIIERRRGVGFGVAGPVGTVVTAGFGGLSLSRFVRGKPLPTSGGIPNFKRFGRKLDPRPGSRRLNRANSFANQFDNIVDVDDALRRRAQAAALDEVAPGSRVSRSLIDESNALKRRRTAIEKQQAKANADLAKARADALKKRADIDERFRQQQAARKAELEGAVDASIQTAKAPGTGRGVLGRQLDRVRALKESASNFLNERRSRRNRGKEKQKLDNAEVKATQTEAKAQAVQNLADEASGLVDSSGRPLRRSPDADASGLLDSSGRPLSPVGSADRAVANATKKAAKDLIPEDLSTGTRRGFLGRQVDRVRGATGRLGRGAFRVGRGGAASALAQNIPLIGGSTTLQAIAFALGVAPEIIPLLARGLRGGLNLGRRAAGGAGDFLGSLRTGGLRGGLDFARQGFGRAARGGFDFLGDRFRSLGGSLRRGITSPRGTALGTAIGAAELGFGGGASLIAGGVAGGVNFLLRRFPSLRQFLGNQAQRLNPFGRRRRLRGGGDGPDGGGTPGATRRPDGVDVQPVDFDSFGDFDGPTRGATRVIDDADASLRDLDPFQAQESPLQVRQAQAQASRAQARSILGLGEDRLSAGLGRRLDPDAPGVATPFDSGLPRTSRPPLSDGVPDAPLPQTPRAVVPEPSGTPVFGEAVVERPTVRLTPEQLAEIPSARRQPRVPVQERPGFQPAVAVERPTLRLTPEELAEIPSARRPPDAGPTAQRPGTVLRDPAELRARQAARRAEQAEDALIESENAGLRRAGIDPETLATAEAREAALERALARQIEADRTAALFERTKDLAAKREAGIPVEEIRDFAGDSVPLDSPLRRHVSGRDSIEAARVDAELRRLADGDLEAVPSRIVDSPSLRGKEVPEVSDFVEAQTKRAAVEAEARALRGLRDPLAVNLSRAESLLAQELGEAAGFFQRDAFRIFRPTDDILLDSATNPVLRTQIADSIRGEIGRRRKLRNRNFRAKDIIEELGLDLKPDRRTSSRPRKSTANDDVGTVVGKKAAAKKVVEESLAPVEPAAISDAGSLVGQPPGAPARVSAGRVSVSPNEVLGPVDTPAGRVLPVEPEFLGSNRGFISRNLSLEDGQRLIREAQESGFLQTDADFQDLLRRRLDPDIPERFRIGEEGDLEQVTGRIENILEAPVGSLQGKLGPKVLETFLDTAADEAVDTAAANRRAGFISEEAFQRQISSRGIGNVQRIIKELKPLIDEFKLGKVELPEVVDIVDPTRKFRSGGKITGPGGPRSDRIPILASNGEFVLNADAVSKLGIPAVEMMNKTGKLPRFQNGGLIDEDAAKARGLDPRRLEQVLTQAGVPGGGTNSILRTREQLFGAGPRTSSVPFTTSDVAPSTAQAPSSDGRSSDKTGTAAGGRGSRFFLDDGSFNIFDQISGTAAEQGNTGVSVAGALKQLSQGQNVYVNQRTGEEVVASSILEGELEQQGFTRKIDPDLELLEAIGQGKVLYFNPRTGETVAASEFLDGELRAQGYTRDERPLNQILEKEVLIERDGSLTLRSKPVGPELFGTNLTPFEKAVNELPPEQRQDPNILRTVRQNVQSELESQRPNERLQAELDAIEEEGFAKGGLVRGLMRRFASGGLLRGPGSSRSDDIPVLASNGEFILNADTTRRLGVSNLEALNRGDLPRFQDGGLVGDVDSSSGGSRTVDVQVDTEAISQAISDAISTALSENAIAIETEAASAAIATAISSAFTDIGPLTAELDSDTVTVSLDIPTNGLPLDTSGLSVDLGDSVGSAIRDRLEAVEGSVTSLRDDTNTLLDTVESADLEGIATLETNLLAAVDTANELSTTVASLESQISEQERRILDQLEFRLNQELSANNIEANVTARVDREVAGLRQNLLQLENQIKSAITTANQAMSRALARV